MDVFLQGVEYICSFRDEGILGNTVSNQYLTAFNAIRFERLFAACFG